MSEYPEDAPSSIAKKLADALSEAEIPVTMGDEVEDEGEKTDGGWQWLKDTGTSVTTKKKSGFFPSGKPISYSDYVALQKDEPTVPTKDYFRRREESYTPDPTPPTCRFFAPSRSTAPMISAVPPKDWPYNDLFGYHGCMNAQMNAASESFGCQIVDNQPSCQFYEPSDDVLLRAVDQQKTSQLGFPEEHRQLRLVHSRYGYGVPGYQVVSVTLNSAGEATAVQTLAEVNIHDYNTDAEKMAEDLFEEQLQNFGAATNTAIDVSVTAPETPVTSYLKELSRS